MHVTFLNPPFLPRFSRESRSPAVTKSDCLYYPHWLAIAAGALNDQENVEIDFIDACADSYTTEQLIERIKKNDSKVVVIDTSTPSIYSDIETSNIIKDALKDVITVLVGPHVTATINETFDYALMHKFKIDVICNGEYDQTLINLIKKIQQNDDYKKINGISYLENNQIKVNPKENPIHSLDYKTSASKIYKKFLNIEKYFMPHTKYPHLSLITGRGCPYRCTFCQLPQVMHGHSYRTRSVKNVVDEFEFIVKEMPEVKAVMLEDDTFTADQPRVIEICNEFVRRGLQKYKLEFTCNSRADVKKDTLKAMYKAGFRMLCVGFEAGDQSTLNSMKKGTKFRIIDEFVKNAADEKIKIHGCFMYGNKDETPETMKNTLNYALKLNIDTAQFYPIMVSPGTADYEYFKRNNMLKTENFSEWNDKHGMHKSTIERMELSNDEIEKFCDFSRRKFYLRPNYIAKKVIEGLKNFDDFKKNFRGFKRLAKHLLTKPGQNV